MTNDFYCENVFSGKVKVDIVKETDNVLAFYHTKPGWTTHIVIVPKQHILSLMEAEPELIKEIFTVAQSIIREQKLNESNYKIIVNGGSFQDSQHLHFHLVSGEKICLK
jgi:histidine triad (HIT) family protein